MAAGHPGGLQLPPARRKACARGHTEEGRVRGGGRGGPGAFRILANGSETEDRSRTGPHSALPASLRASATNITLEHPDQGTADHLDLASKWSGTPKEA